MDAVFFGAKRAYYATLRYSCQQLKGSGVTPARLDLMRCIFDSPQHEISQAGLCWALRVARSTVSRMVRSLEELGLVAREPCLSDGRVQMCRLTREGLQRVEDILERCVDSRVVRRAVNAALAPRHRRDRARARSLFQRLSKTFAAAFGVWFCYWGADPPMAGSRFWQPRRRLPKRTADFYADRASDATMVDS